MTTPNADEQDQAAMERLANGDDTALEPLMNRHAERLFHYLLRVLQNEARAADAAEEAFVRVYQNRLKFRPNHRFTTWLYTIATNLARDLQRYQARHPQLSLDGHPDGSDADFRETLAETRPGPGEALETS
jgi:RNA polymerase sigma-70 factor (ECF subfamily)